MAANQQAFWALLSYAMVIAPWQAVAHIVIAIIFQVARLMAPERPVPRWIPLAYTVYLLTFLTASFLLIDIVDIPGYYAPWREAANAAVTPLFDVSLAGFLALAVLVIIDLIRSVRARAAA